eukprot:9120806-Pyramimonas_sp.AAC.1
MGNPFICVYLYVCPRASSLILLQGDAEPGHQGGEGRDPAVVLRRGAGRRGRRRLLCGLSLIHI